MIEGKGVGIGFDSGVSWAGGVEMDFIRGRDFTSVSGTILLK